MNNLLIKFFTAFVVSLDSFVVGFTLSLNKRDDNLPISVAFATLTLCIVTTILGAVIQDVVSEKTVNLIGAMLLIVIAVNNLFDCKYEQISIRKKSLFQSIMVGFAVALDAGIANLSLSLNETNVLAPLLFTAFHYVTVLLGQKLACNVSLRHANVISAVALVVLAISKLL